MKTARFICLLCTMGTVAAATAPVFSQSWGTNVQSMDASFSPDYSLFSAKPGTIAASGVYRGARGSGRELVIRENSIYGSTKDGMAGWYIAQDVEAIGRDKVNRFTSDVKHWGIAYGKTISVYRSVTAGVFYTHTDASDGNLVTGNSSLILSKINVNAYGVYIVRKQGDMTWTYTGQYADVKGGSESAKAMTGMAILEKPIGKNLTARASLGLTGQRMHSSNTLKTVMNGALTYHPNDWFTMEIGGALAPSGIPVAGSSLSGVSCYGIYFPASDGLVGEMKDSTIAALTFRAVVSIPVK